MEYGNGGSEESQSGGKDDNRQIIAIFGSQLVAVICKFNLCIKERQPSVCYHLIFHQAGTLLLVTIIGLKSKLY